MEFLNVLEWISVFFNLLFVVLIIKELKIGWIFGILGSLVSIFLFYQTQLYSEAVLYSYYVVMGFYGWWRWSEPGNKLLPVMVWGTKKHLVAVLIGIIGTKAIIFFKLIIVKVLCILPMPNYFFLLQQLLSIYFFERILQ